MNTDEFYGAKSTRKCMSAADDVFKLFNKHRLGSSDGMFTLAIALARCIQTECVGMSEREAMVLSLAQIMTRAVVTLDETIVGVLT